MLQINPCSHLSNKMSKSTPTYRSTAAATHKLLTRHLVNTNSSAWLVITNSSARPPSQNASQLVQQTLDFCFSVRALTMETLTLCLSWRELIQDWKKIWIIGEVGYCTVSRLFIESTSMSPRTGMKPWSSFNDASSHFTALLWLCVKHVLTFKAKRYSKISNRYIYNAAAHYTYSTWCSDLGWIHLFVLIE